MMVFLSYFAIAVSHVCLITIFLIIGDLSRILGVALKKKPVFKLMYLSSVLALAGMISNFLGDSFFLAAIGLDILAIIVGSGVTYYYWKWLPADLAKG